MKSEDQHDIFYLSPFCKSPMAFGRFILWRTHLTVPTPVAAWLWFGFELDKFTAS